MPTRKPGATLRAQWLGQQLRTLRESAGMTLKQAGEYLQRDGSMMSRVESAVHPIRRGDVLALLDLYGVSDERTREGLLRLPLLTVVERIETFLQLHLRTAHKIVGFEKERHEEIPRAALREAVVNALVHRDYTIPGPTRVFVLSDRVEVRSPGRPPNSVDAEAMRAGVHVTRNPHIYSRVVEAELATRAGTGIRRIARLLRETNGSSLGIAISDAEVALTLPRGPSTASLHEAG